GCPAPQAPRLEHPGRHAGYRAAAQQSQLAAPAAARRRRCEDGLMADMRRRSSEPPPGPPQIQLKPGMAQELLRELAPLLAEDGIDAGNIDVPDVQTLQRALNRAMERHNMSLFTPVGQARELAAVTMRLAAAAMPVGPTPRAATRRGP